MKPQEALKEIEEEIREKGYSAVGPKFWRLVKQVKEDPALVEKYADRIGEIDQKFFMEKVAITIPTSLGSMLALLGIVVSIILLLLGKDVLGPYQLIIPFISALILSTVVHPLAHILAGRAGGIRFTFYFLDGPLKIEPSVKTDYSTYLRATPGQRITMHLAGPVATILSPLVVMIAAFLIGYPPNSLYVLVVFSLFFLITEFIPLILVKIGSPKILGIDFRKSDTYRVMREKKMV